MSLHFRKVGVRYCVEHNGIANEDDRKCDFSYDEKGACRLRELGYRSRSTPDKPRRPTPVPANAKGGENDG